MKLHPVDAIKILAATTGLVLLDQSLESYGRARRLGSATLPRNPAYAFGVVGGSPAQLVIVSIAVITLMLVAMGALAARYDMAPGIPARITAGVLSNTNDRIQFGAVRDFFVTPWAIINVADLCVIAGILGLACTLVLRATTYERVVGFAGEEI